MILALLIAGWAICISISSLSKRGFESWWNSEGMPIFLICMVLIPPLLLELFDL